MRAAGFPTTPEGQVDFEPPGTEDARLEAAAAREGQVGPSPQGERGEVGHSPRQGQDGSSPRGERHEVEPSPRRGQEGSPPHEGQEEGPVPPPTLQQNREELEAQARLWQEHQRRQQGEPVQQQV